MTDEMMDMFDKYENYVIMCRNHGVEPKPIDQNWEDQYLRLKQEKANRPYICPYCRRNFTFMNSLREHMAGCNGNGQIGDYDGHDSPPNWSVYREDSLDELANEAQMLGFYDQGREDKEGQPNAELSSVDLEILEKMEEDIRLDKTGNLEDSYTLIADYWSVYLNKHITREDAAYMLMLFKLARVQVTNKEDHRNDLVSYAEQGYVEGMHNESP